MTLDQQITRLAHQVVFAFREARVTREPIRMKYVNLGDFGGTDPVQDSYGFEVAGPFDAMQPLIPILKKHGFRWDAGSKSWRLDATLYAYNNRKRQNLWDWARKNQEAAYRELKPLVEKYNQEAAAENRGGKPSVRELMQKLQSKERLTQRLNTYGLTVQFEWPNRYSVDEAKAWVTGNTFPIKDVMAKHGFRFAQGKYGKGWWLPAVEFHAIVDKWAADVIRATPAPAAAAPAGGDAPFTAMSRMELLAWIKGHNVVNDDLRANEWYDGEVSGDEVLRKYLQNMPKWTPEMQREVFNRGSLYDPRHTPW